MEQTIMSMKLELVTNSSGNSVMEELHDELEGSKVIILTDKGTKIENMCIGGNLCYISETNGYDENVILDYENTGLEFRFIESPFNKIQLRDIIEITIDEKPQVFLLMQLQEKFILYSDVMNIVIGLEFNFTNLEDLQLYLDNNYLGYKIFKRI